MAQSLPSKVQISSAHALSQNGMDTQATSLAVANVQPLMHDDRPRPAGLFPVQHEQPVAKNYQTMEFGHGAGRESPVYVNVKQFWRILKRRRAQNGEHAWRGISKERKPYQHESRHSHAMHRPRGPSGRFLPGKNVAAMEEVQAGGEGDERGDVEGGAAAETQKDS